MGMHVYVSTCTCNLISGHFISLLQTSANVSIVIFFRIADTVATVNDNEKYNRNVCSTEGIKYFSCYNHPLSARNSTVHAEIYYFIIILLRK